MPTKRELDKSGPKTSVYRLDFPTSSGSEKQKLIHRPKTSFDEDFCVSTSYRYSHGLDNPNKDALNAMSNVGLTTDQTRRQKSSMVSGRESVASCMSWYIPKPPTTPLIPQATQTAPMPAKKMTPASTQITCYPTTTQNNDVTAAEATSQSPPAPQKASQE